MRLPDGIECWHCILQWTYVTGNRYECGQRPPFTGFIVPHISCNTLCATLPRFQRGPKIDNCDQAMLSFHHQMGNWATDGRVRDAGLHRRRGGETGLRAARDLQGVRGHLHRSRVSSRLHGIDLGGYKLQIYTELRKSLCKSC